MFDTERLAMRIAKLEHRKMEHDEREVPLVVITFEINPFKPELAKELDDFVRGTLFTRTDAEVTSKLKGAIFNLGIRPQEIAIYAAPDQSEASFVIAEAKIGALHARRSTKSPTWRLVFTATCEPGSEHQLAQIVEGYLKTRYVTFADAQPDLFSEVGKEARKTRKAERAAAATTGATAH